MTPDETTLILAALFAGAGTVRAIISARVHGAGAGPRHTSRWARGRTRRPWGWRSISSDDWRDGYA
jgi:hypothetical protein